MSFLKPHVEAAALPPPPPAPEPAKGPFRFNAPDPQVRSSLDALDALAEARTRAERILASELQRMEDSFIVALKQLEDRLAATQAELADVQRRYDNLLKNQLQNERHIQTLKELKRVLESV